MAYKFKLNYSGQFMAWIKHNQKAALFFSTQ